MKKITGIFGGRFTPLHNGHVGAILRAAEQVETLYVVLSYAKSDPIQGRVRLKWMNAVFSPYDNIKIIDVERKKILETVEEWKEDSINIRFNIQKLENINYNEVMVNKVFVGSNDHDDMFNICYPEAEIVVLDPLRSDITISGTEIRANMYKHWEYLPKFVRKDYAKSVVVANKRLRNQLTDRFSTVKVEDIHQMYLETYGSAIDQSEIQVVLCAQLTVLMDEAAYNSNRVYFVPPVYSNAKKVDLVIHDGIKLDEAIEQVKELIK